MSFHSFIRRCAYRGTVEVSVYVHEISGGAVLRARCSNTASPNVRGSRSPRSSGSSWDTTRSRAFAACSTRARVVVERRGDRRCRRVRRGTCDGIRRARYRASSARTICEVLASRARMTAMRVHYSSSPMTRWMTPDGAEMKKPSKSSRSCSTSSRRGHAVDLQVRRRGLGVVRFELEPDVGMAQVRHLVDPETVRAELENAAVFLFLDHRQRRACRDRTRPSAHRCATGT